jgi:hypothetical protein
MKYYLQLDYKTGLFYAYSKDSQEGYEKYTSKTGNVSYRKYFKKGIYGNLKTMYFADTDRGMQLRVIMTQGSESEDGFYAMLFFPVYDQSRNLDRFVESLVTFLPNMEPGEAYRIYPYVLDVKLDSGKTVQNRGVSVKKAELDGEGGGDVTEKVERALKFQGRDEEYESGMVPTLVFEKDLGGKYAPTALSIAQRNDFLKKVLQENVERLNVTADQNSEGNSQEQEKPAQKPAEKPKAKVNLEPEDDDDIPF